MYPDGDCLYCLYSDNSDWQYPCSVCQNYSRWIPSEMYYSHPNNYFLEKDEYDIL